MFKIDIFCLKENFNQFLILIFLNYETFVAVYILVKLSNQLQLIFYSTCSIPVLQTLMNIPNFVSNASLLEFSSFIILMLSHVL